MLAKLKKLCFSILFVFLFSQEETTSVFTGSFGSVTLGDRIYNHFSLKPEISGGKLGVGLDLYFYFDEEGNLNDDNWDFSNSDNSFKTLIDKIYYIRWGSPLDDFYFRFGALPKITMGYGSLINNYSNVADYPNYRRKGITFNYQYSKFSLQFVHSDFKEYDAPSLMGVSANFEYIDKLNLNVTLATDLNQQKGLVDSDEDGYPDYMDDFPYDIGKWNEYAEIVAQMEDPNSDIYSSCYNTIPGPLNQTCQAIVDQYNRRISELNQLVRKKDEVSGMSFGLSYDLTSRLSIYSEWAQLIGKTSNPYSSNSTYDPKLGSGYIPIGFKMNWDKVSFSIDYRQHDEKFIFNYWNQNYDLNRIVVYTEDDGNSGLVSHFETKEQNLYKYGESRGIRFSIATNMKYFGMDLNYSHMNSDLWNKATENYQADENNTLYLSFNIDTSNIQKVEIAEVFYQQSYVSKPFDFEPNENTLLGYNIGIDLSDNMVLIFKGRKSYVPSSDRLNEYESVKNTQIETQILF